MKILVLILALVALSTMAESGRNRQWSFGTSDMIDDLENELNENLDGTLYLREMCSIS